MPTSDSTNRRRSSNLKWLIAFACLIVVGTAFFFGLAYGGAASRAGIGARAKYEVGQDGEVREVLVTGSVERETFASIPVGVVVQAQVRDKHVAPAERHALHASEIMRREEYIAKAREQCVEACQSMGVGGGGELFDQAVASYPDTVTRTIWWRYPLAVLWCVSPSVVVISVLGLIVCGWREGVRAKKRRRERRGLCAKCAYNRAGLDDRPCPECGTPGSPVTLNLP